MNYADRTTSITLDGKEYKLLLTTKAVSEIGKRFGGFGNIETELKKEDGQAMDSVCFIVAVLANQVIARENRENPQNAKPQLTADDVMELTMPFEITEYSDAIKKAIENGMHRNVISKEEKNTDEKNVAAE